MTRALAAPALALLFAACSVGGLDGPGGRAEPLGVSPSTKQIRWLLRTADIQAGYNNGYEAFCGQPDGSDQCGKRGIWCGTADRAGKPRCTPAPTQLNFYVENKRKGPVTTVSIPCPRGESGGTVDIKLPDAAGPYVLWANLGAPDPSRATSAFVDPFGPSGIITITVYVCGCDWAPSGESPTCGAQPR